MGNPVKDLKNSWYKERSRKRTPKWQKKKSTVHETSFANPLSDFTIKRSLRKQLTFRDATTGLPASDVVAKC